MKALLALVTLVSVASLSAGQYNNRSSNYGNSGYGNCPSCGNGGMQQGRPYYQTSQGNAYDGASLPQQQQQPVQQQYVQQKPVQNNTAPASQPAQEGTHMSEGQPASDNYVYPKPSAQK